MARLPLLLLLLVLPAYAKDAADPPQDGVVKLDLDAMARAKDGPRADERAAQDAEATTADPVDETIIPETEPAAFDPDSPAILPDGPAEAGTEAAVPDGDGDGDAGPEPGTGMNTVPDGDVDPAPGAATADDPGTASAIAAETGGPEETEENGPVAATAADGDTADPAETSREADACIQTALELLDAAQRGDFAAATADFDDAMQAALPPVQLARAWNSLGQFGDFESRGQPHLSRSSGFVAVNIPLIYEKAALYMQVACGADGKIGGFHVQPLEAMPAQP